MPGTDIGCGKFVRVSCMPCLRFEIIQLSEEKTSARDQNLKPNFLARGPDLHMLGGSLEDYKRAARTAKRNFSYVSDLSYHVHWMGIGKQHVNRASIRVLSVYLVL